MWGTDICLDTVLTVPTIYLRIVRVERKCSVEKVHHTVFCIWAPEHPAVQQSHLCSGPCKQPVLRNFGAIGELTVRSSVRPTGQVPRSEVSPAIIAVQIKGGNMKTIGMAPRSRGHSPSKVRLSSWYSGHFLLTYRGTRTQTRSCSTLCTPRLIFHYGCSDSH
jgi:hypothetical protein